VAKLGVMVYEPAVAPALLVKVHDATPAEGVAVQSVVVPALLIEALFDVNVTLPTESAGLMVAESVTVSDWPTEMLLGLGAAGVRLVGVVAVTVSVRVLLALQA
jgi:hypothetical protein